MTTINKRSISHNQRIITKAFLQCSADKSPTHLHLLVETIRLGILDGDFKVWRCEYCRQNYHSLINWVRDNLAHHPNLKLERKVIVSWRIDE